MKHTTCPSHPYESLTSDKPLTLRPGAGDAYALPSRVGDELVPHALPISLGARGDVVEGEGE